MRKCMQSPLKLATHRLVASVVVIISLGERCKQIMSEGSGGSEVPMSSASGWEGEESFIEQVVGDELGAPQSGPLRQEKEEDLFLVCSENLMS